MEAFIDLEAKDWKEGQENQNGQILDVRTAEEFSDSFIEGAENIDKMAADFERKIEILDKSRPYYVYCRSGARSAAAMYLMKDKGFSEVYNLQGGIMAWELKGFEVEYGDDF